MQEPKSTQTSESAARSRPPGGLQASAGALDEQREAAHLDRRRLQRALAIAVLLHLALLAWQLPSFAGPAVSTPDPPEDYVYALVTPRFEPPKRDPIEIPQRRNHRRPMPDPDPDLPEVRPVDAPDFAIDLDAVDVLVLPTEPPPAVPPPPGPLHLAAGMEKPRKIFAPAPVYSELARRTRTQGVVVLQTVIDAAGRVGEIEVLRGLPFGLSDAAVAAVQQWRFEPALLRGEPVKVYYTVTVHFELQ